MSKEYRIAIPLVETYYDDGPASGKPLTVHEEIWTGSEYPDEDVVRSAVDEAEVPAPGVFPIRSMSGNPVQRDLFERSIGDEIVIQRRRRMIKFLGWKTVDSLSLDDQFSNE